MQLVGSCHLALPLQSGEEIGIVVKRASQLVRVALVQIVPQIVEPSPCLVIIQGVAATNADVLEEVIRLDQSGDGKEIPLSLILVGGLFPYEVGLVERRYAYHLQSLTLHILHTRLDELVPLLWLAAIVCPARIVSLVCVQIVAIAVGRTEQRFVVAVEVYLCRACQLDEVATPLQLLFLTVSKGVCAVAIVSHKVIGLERHTPCSKVSLADMRHTALHIEIPIPCGIHAPIHLVLFASVRQIKNDFHISPLCCFQIVSPCLCRRSEE